MNNLLAKTGVFDAAGPDAQLRRLARVPAETRTGKILSFIDRQNFLLLTV
jgi:hypothetical protein